MSYIPLSQIIWDIGDRIKFGNGASAGYWSGWFSKARSHCCRIPPIVPQPDEHVEEGTALDRILGSTVQMVEAMRKRGATQDEIDRRLAQAYLPEVTPERCMICERIHITSQPCESLRRSDSIRQSGRDDGRRRGTYGDRLSAGFTMANGDFR